MRLVVPDAARDGFIGELNRPRSGSGLTRYGETQIEKFMRAFGELRARGQGELYAELAFREQAFIQGEMRGAQFINQRQLRLEQALGREAQTEVQAAFCSVGVESQRQNDFAAGRGAGRNQLELMQRDGFILRF